MLKLTKLDWHDAIDERHREHNYLIVADRRTFVGTIRAIKSDYDTMPPNGPRDSDTCYYVVPPTGPCVLIDKVTELYRIDTSDE